MLNKWQDMFDIVLSQGFYGNNRWQVISKSNDFRSNYHSTRSSAIREAKGRWNRYQRNIEKALLGA